jgi:2-polyprenyl-3-methyl-5-hydroxy-6-metoxy-1,4-benzoquinol methylase
MFETIRPFVQGHVLEAGSGTGNISEYFLRNGFTITLSDTDEFYIEELKKKFSSFGNLGGVKNIDLQHGHFATAYADLKETFDTVFLLNVLEHLADDNAAIRNIRYLLKPAGRLIILTPAYAALYSRLDKELNHYRRYTVSRLATLLQHNGFIPEKKFYFNALGIVGWLYGKALKLRYIPSGEMKIYNQLTPLAKLIDKIVFNKTGLSAVITGIKQ